jgi:hypothetical protein
MKRTACRLGLLAASLPAFAAPPPDDMKATVDHLVNETTKDASTEARAFDRMLELGSAAVPYLIAHLGDDRRLPEQSLWVRRPGFVDRQYKPWYVHDGLEFVLKELTGFTMGPLNGHLLKGQREQNTRKWIAWCVQRFPAQAEVCRSGTAGRR